MKLRKIIGWILVFTPSALIEAISILPNAIGMMILIFFIISWRIHNCAKRIASHSNKYKPYHITYRRGGGIETF